jgi:hypothetical protein
MNKTEQNDKLPQLAQDQKTNQTEVFHRKQNSEMSLTIKT